MGCLYPLSIVLSTRNRGDLVGAAIEHLLAQHDVLAPYELVVVDNGSTDRTRDVVHALMAGAGDRLRYVFERTTGLSHARNAGIAVARYPAVAFTDDDVRVSGDWVRIIQQTFDERHDVECLGGRTLPVWPSRPPAWLTELHWVGPLALQDYGDVPFIIDARRPLCLAGANFAFRARVFERIGLFSTAFPRAQDTELLLRLYRAGARALYVPGMRADAVIDPERLTKAYHRRWHANIGRCNARMRFEELADPVLGLRESIPEFTRVCGVPAFALRQFWIEIWRWLVNAGAGREAKAFQHQNRAMALVGYMREARTLNGPLRGSPPAPAMPSRSARAIASPAQATDAGRPLAGGALSHDSLTPRRDGE